jgi:MarR family 2-MHQ and catechol resistance regulon transcriptional repressor
MSEKNNKMFEFWTKFNSAHSYFLRTQFKSINKAKITLPQFHVLLVLNFNGPTALKKISELLAVTNANITCIIHNLGKLDLVKTETSKIDRRVIIADLTSHGRELVDRYLPEFNNVMNNALGKLSDSEKENLFASLLKF